MTGHDALAGCESKVGLSSTLKHECLPVNRPAGLLGQHWAGAPKVAIEPYRCHCSAQFPVLVTPLLGGDTLRLLGLVDGSSGLDLAVKKQIPETVFQEIAFRAEGAERVLQLIGEDKLEWCFRYTVKVSVSMYIKRATETM